MARKEITRYFDDLDGTPLDDTEVHIVRFSYRNRAYVLDLSEDNARAFDDAIRPYVEKATPDNAGGPGRGRRARGTDTATRARNRIIRQWAKDQGIQVADRGALPKDVIQRYEDAH